MAKKMEKNDGLLEIYHEFSNEQNEKMREYHVDIHENFCNLPLTLSVRRSTTQLRPTIIIGQDESVFKQHSFGRQCIVTPERNTL